MSPRYHSCKGSGWKFERLLDSAERILLALLRITRYPFSGKACFCIALRDVPKRFSLCQMITNPEQKCSLAHDIVRVIFCVPKDKPNHWRYAIIAYGGIRTHEYRAWQAQGARILLAYTLEYPRAPLWRIDSNTRLKYPCKHILTFRALFFTEKKLRR